LVVQPAQDRHSQRLADSLDGARAGHDAQALLASQSAMISEERLRSACGRKAPRLDVQHEPGTALDERGRM